MIITIKPYALLPGTIQNQICIKATAVRQLLPLHLRHRQWLSVDVISQSQPDTTRIQPHIRIGGVSIREMTQRDTGIQVKGLGEHPSDVKISINISSYFRTDNLVFRIALFIISIPPKCHTQVPFIIERNPAREIHDRRTLEQINRDRVCQPSVELMPCQAHTLIHSLMNSPRSYLISIHKSIFKRKGHIVVHRPDLLISTTQKLVGMKDGSRNSICSNAMNGLDAIFLREDRQCNHRNY